MQVMSQSWYVQTSIDNHFTAVCITYILLLPYKQVTELLKLKKRLQFYTKKNYLTLELTFLYSWSVSSEKPGVRNSGTGMVL